MFELKELKVCIQWCSEAMENLGFYIKKRLEIFFKNKNNLSIKIHIKDILKIPVTFQIYSKPFSKSLF